MAVHGAHFPGLRRHIPHATPRAATRSTRQREIVGAILVLLLIVGVFWWSSTSETTVETRGAGGGHADVPHRATGGPPDHYFDLHGQDPEAHPATRLAIGFLALDQSRQRAVDVFGSPSSSGPDINGQASTWKLPGAELTVSTWADDPESISGLYLHVPPGSQARFAIFGHAVISGATLRDVVTAWGKDYTSSTSPYDDFTLQYVECVGPYPVVIKFDQDIAAPDNPEPGSPRWHEKVTSMLVGYADEPSGAGGCRG